jgi:hypothetical protein
MTQSNRVFKKRRASSDPPEQHDEEAEHRTFSKASSTSRTLSLAHLSYERCLIDKVRGSPDPDIGGQAFCIVDDGPLSRTATSIPSSPLSLMV